MKDKVYWCGIEYVYKKDALDYEKLNGGFVYAFIKTFDVQTALNSVLDELNMKNLSPVLIEFITPYEEGMEWESEEKTQHYIQIFEIASNSNEVVFDDFYAYEKE